MSQTAPLAVALVDPASAVPTYADRLARGIGAIGVATTLFCAPSPYHALPTADGYRRDLVFARWLAYPALASMGRRSIARRAGRAISYLPDWLRLERRLTRARAEVVHLQWTLDARWDAFWLRRLRRQGRRVVVTVHNAQRREDAPGRAGGEPQLLSAADGVVVLGASVAEELRSRNLLVGPRVAVVPPSVPPPPDRRLGQAAARARWGLPLEAPIVLFFGLVRPYKGVDRLIAAFDRAASLVPDARLIVAGRSPDGSGTLDARIAGLEASQRVLRFDRYLPQSDADELLAACDLVALPYREGSASAVVLEAWRHERLPLATAIGALGEQVIDGETGRSLPPGDDAALARALTELLADRRGTLAAGHRAAVAARLRFPAEREAAAHIALYRAILGATRAA